MLLFPELADAQHYTQTNLVSDVSGMMAPIIDSNLQNPWGLARSATGPWWVADNNKGLSTVYNGAGTINPLVVTIPPPAGSNAAATPTGIIFNGTQDFALTTGNPGLFIFDTEDGTISAWNPAVNATKAVLKVDNSKVGGGAVYKGLEFAEVNGAHFLYAANFRSGQVEVYDTNFKRVNLGPDAFRDYEMPEGFAPFNVQAIGPNLYVTYAKQDAAKHDPVAGAGLGFVNVFSPTGALISRLQNGPWMNAPWGVVWTPRDFGEFSNTILVGNFRSGQIAAFNGLSGRFLGMMLDPTGKPITISGLWALVFGGGNANSGPANTLYFTAGINNEKDGLFGTLTPIAAELNEGDEH